MQPSTDRFLQELERAASRYEWEVVNGEAIRTTRDTGPKQNQMCPMEAVHHYRTGEIPALTLYHHHFDYLNVLAKKNIMKAADTPLCPDIEGSVFYPHLHEKLRSRMLEILSLEDQV